MSLTQISTLESGEINYDELRERLAANVGKPAILNLNIGTTVKGAVDDLDRVLEVLKVRPGERPGAALGQGCGGVRTQRHGRTQEGPQRQGRDASTLGTACMHQCCPSYELVPGSF